MVRDTSIEAYHKIKDEGLLSERRWQVYDGLYQHGPCTANELHQRMGRAMGTRNVQANLHARLNELVTLGVVKEVETRECSVTGMSVIVWDVTNHLPKEPQLKNKKKTSLADVMQAIDDLRKEVRSAIRKEDQLAFKL